MILCRLDDAPAQLPPGAAFAKALEFLRRPGLAGLPDGRYEIDGGRLFAIVQRYATAAAAAPKFEAHRKFADIQFVAAGAEIIGWAPLSRLLVDEAYHGEEDICFGRVEPGAWTPALLRSGELAVLYPEDAHAPRLAAGVPGAVTKIVLKVALPAEKI
jgi:YhcH/YjgK/YiaL family protein